MAPALALALTAALGPALALAAALALGAAPLAAQGDLQAEIAASQRRLEEVRAERERLQQEMARLQSSARDVASELQNIERQLSASRSVLAEIEFQANAVSEQIQETSASLLRARERLSEAQAILNRRLRDIYKRGPLHTVRVLLGAESFADLLTRYRYLRLIAAYDRSIVDRIEVLEQQLVERDQELRESMRSLGVIRQARLGELAQLRNVEADRQRTLEQFRSQQARTTSRLEELESDEARLTGLITDLEARRRELEARRSTRGGPATLADADAGSLPWPVDGEVLYRFGPQRQPNGTVLRWNGLGIRAPTGTPVRAVRAGTVVLAGPFEGYGPTVVLSHGGGFYTLYLYLEEVGVVQGRRVEAGQVVGTVGGAATPEGPHVEFQIRAPAEDGGSPEAQDPLRWLRPRGGGG
ncbi:MAG: hypothetical protein D6701_11010 [Gemmatimonadetes bacterium]|nr:MAG: hypothetical protein D6701_11010 [Gemmatimonadota bacterium]